MFKSPKASLRAFKGALQGILSLNPERNPKVRGRCSEATLQLKEATGGEFRVYKASIMLL